MSKVLTAASWCSLALAAVALSILLEREGEV